MAHTIAALANTNPGSLFLGISDQGEVVGLQLETAKDRDLLLQKILNIATQVVKPAALAIATFLSYQGKTVLQVFVPRGSQVPYVVDGVIYFRKTSAVVKAGPDEIRAIVRNMLDDW